MRTLLAFAIVLMTSILRQGEPIMQRITVSDLEAVCSRINRTVNGEDAEPWTRGDDGHLHQTSDVYVLSGAYGGYSLHRHCSVDGQGESHGVSDVFGSGHIPKRELYDRMQSFLRGVEVAA